MKLAQALQQAGFSTKANKLSDALLQFVGSDFSVTIDDNPREQINKGYLYNPDVYAIVNMITNASKGIKWYAYEVKDQKKFSKYERLPTEAKQFQLEKVYRTKEQALEEVADPNNPLVRLLNRPNPLHGWAEFIEGVLGFKLVTGNSYIHGVMLENGANAGLINELWVMPSQFMRIKAGKGVEEVVTGYELEIGTYRTPFSPDEVLHLKYWNPDYESRGSHLYGLSPLRASSRVVKQSNDSYTAQASMLQNSGAMGILSVDPESMTYEQAETLQRDYYTKYGGPAKRGKIVIAGAKMQWQQIGMSPVDLNIIESQKMSLRDLCNVYGINSALLNDPDNKVYNNVKEARRALYMEKVLPELDTLRDEMNRWLVAPINAKTGKQYHLDYDLESIPALQADMKLVMEQMRDAWWTTGNEKRMAMGYDEDPVMAGYFIPMGLAPIGATMEEPAKLMGEFRQKRTYNDYPQSATNTAKRALKFSEENPNDCATGVGLARANQLANREPLSFETVQRTYSFLSRAKTYDTGSFTDSDGKPVCGSISYAYWGGDSMLNWAKRIVEENA